MWRPSRKQSLWVLLGLVVVATAVVLFSFRRSVSAGDGFHSGVFEPPRDAPEFSLQGSKGARVSMQDLRGKIVILEFGFTFCQNVCPVTLANLKLAFDKLGPAAKDVQLVFVTVDPRRDTPERLAEFLGAFNPSFLGATGTQQELESMRTAYGVMAEEVASKNEKLKYEMSHSSFIYFVDKRGKLRTLVPFGKPVEDLVHDINLLLKE